MLKWERHVHPARAEQRGVPFETRQTVLRGHAVSQHVRRIRLTQPLERTVAKLANPLAARAPPARV